jgi:phage minor structural protein
MIYVFDRDEKLQAIYSNEKVGACPIFTADLTEELNGAVTLEIEIPADHDDAQYLQEDYLIAIKDKEDAWQLFYVRELEEVHGSTWTKRAYCEHCIVDLEDNIITNYFADRKTAIIVLPELLNNTRWQLGTASVHSNVHDLTVKYGTVMEAFTTFVSRWEIEVKYRIVITGQKITARYIDIYTQRGTDTGKRFEYSKDMSEISRTIDTSGIKTALYGLGAENELGDPMTIGEVNGGYDYVVDEVARAMWGRPASDGVRRHRYGVYQNTQQPDKSALRDETTKALQVVKDPLVEYVMKVTDIVNITGLAHEAVTLGMTVTAIDRDMKLQLKARCIKMKTDLLNDDFSDLTIGNFLPTSTTTTEKRITSIEESTGNYLEAGDNISTAWLEGAISTINNEINTGGGTVTLTENDGILVENTEKTKAIRLMGGVLAIANSRDATTGLYNWRTFGTGDGFVADQITSGYMLFDRARGGTLLLGGSNNANGRLVVYNANGDMIADLSAVRGGFDGLYVGTLTADNILNANFKAITYIVNPATGNDNNDGLTSSTPFKRLQTAINKIPKNNMAAVNIYCATGAVLNEYEVHLEGFYGNGQITIDLGGGVLHGMLYIKYNNQYMRIVNGKVNQIYGTQYIGDGTVTVRYSQFVSLSSVEVYSRNNVDYGIVARGANVVLEACKFYDQTTACIESEYGATIDIISNCQGSARAGLRAMGTGRIACANVSVPRGTVTNTELVLGGTMTGTPASYDVGTSTPPASPPLTKRWEATTIRSWNFKTGWRSAPNYDIYQGEWTDSNGSYGNHKGCFWFNNSDIISTLSGRTLKGARIRLKRRSRGGYSNEIQAQLWALASDATIVGGGQPVVDYNCGKLASYAWNDEEWMEIPTWVVTAIINKSYYGFCLYINAGTNNDYLIMENSATLEVVYT